MSESEQTKDLRAIKGPFKELRAIKGPFVDDKEVAAWQQALAASRVADALERIAEAMMSKRQCVREIATPADAAKWRALAVRAATSMTHLMSEFQVPWDPDNCCACAELASVMDDIREASK